MLILHCLKNDAFKFFANYLAKIYQTQFMAAHHASLGKIHCPSSRRASLIFPKRFTDFKFFNDSQTVQLGFTALVVNPQL